MYNVAMAVSAIIDWKFLTLLAERLLSLKPEILNPAIWNFPTPSQYFQNKLQRPKNPTGITTQM